MATLAPTNLMPYFEPPSMAPTRRCIYTRADIQMHIKKTSLKKKRLCLLPFHNYNKIMTIDFFSGLSNANVLFHGSGVRTRCILRSKIEVTSRLHSAGCPKTQLLKLWVTALYGIPECGSSKTFGKVQDYCAYNGSPKISNS